MLYPIAFRPRFKERVWGGRRLETRFGKSLPPGIPVGESWEIADRPDDVSVIANGPLTGRDLRWLMANHGEEIMGRRGAAGRFPLLVKLLDAREVLSVQVHPPAPVAARLGGEPKTEVWLVAAAAPGAELHVGLRRGVTRAEFERRIADGTVAGCIHRVPVRAGDAMFLPSGRVHALGAGLVIFEIQQNSDTTYRVFDWNRTGTDGKPRALHIAESLASIDFDDFEPSPIRAVDPASGNARARLDGPGAPFAAWVEQIQPGGTLTPGGAGPWVVGVVEGALRVQSPIAPLELNAGGFCLVPASLGAPALSSTGGANVIHAMPM